MYNLTQFVLKFLISFLLVFFFVCFYCLFTPAKIFLKFLKIFKILNTSYVHMSIYISTIIFLASLQLIMTEARSKRRILPLTFINKTSVKTNRMTKYSSSVTAQFVGKSK